MIHVLLSECNVSLNYIDVQLCDILFRHLVTSPFNLVYFQILCKNYCQKKYRSYNQEIGTKLSVERIKCCTVGPLIGANA